MSYYPSPVWLRRLFTPPSKVIDTVLAPSDVHDPQRMAAEIDRITRLIDDCKMPFLLKLAQSVSGRGVYQIHTVTQRTALRTMLSAQLGHMLRQINGLNHHMHPCSLVLQEFVHGTAIALSFFVTSKGRLIFIACCDQQFEANGHWAGASISYTRQPEFHATYRDILEKVAAFLHQRGYYGPAGVDVITDRSGKQYIVDLNTRVTGDFHLGPLAGHFVQRGLLEVSFIQRSFRTTRTTFEDVFASEIQKGSVVITGWVCDQSASISKAAINIGGRNSLEIEEICQRIRAFAATG